MAGVVVGFSGLEDGGFGFGGLASDGVCGGGWAQLGGWGGSGLVVWLAAGYVVVVVGRGCGGGWRWVG
jgi:hypothetical protein